MKIKVIFGVMSLGLQLTCAMDEADFSRQIQHHKLPGMDEADLASIKYQIEHHKLPGTEEVNPFSYANFLTLKAEGKITEEQCEELVQHAYNMGSPILFASGDRIITPDQYRLSCLWIHDAPLNEAEHLMGMFENEKDNERLQDNVMRPLLDWQTKQPDAYIDFWIHSAMIPNYENVLSNTLAYLTDAGVNMEQIKFRCITEIDFVQKNIDIFQQTVPVYYRVDLLKAVIADHIMHTDNIQYAIHVDSDIIAISNKHLFDQKTLGDLVNMGRVFGSCKVVVEENSFIILSRDSFADAVNQLLIDIAAEYGQNIEKVSSAGKDQAFFRLYTDYFKPLTLQAKTLAVNLVAGGDFTEKRIQKLYNSPGYPAAIQRDYVFHRCPGKYMIFPPSRFGSLGTLTREERCALQAALHRPDLD